MNLSDIAAKANELHGLHAAAIRVGLERAREIGDLLLAAKRQLKHGEFQPWLKANATFSVAAGQNYMKIAREWPRIAKAIGDTAERGAFNRAQVLIGRRKPASKPEAQRVAANASPGDVAEMCMEIVTNCQDSRQTAELLQARLTAFLCRRRRDIA